MATPSRTSSTSNVNPNMDNGSVKIETKSESESSDSESSSDEEEFASGQIKEENDNANAIDQLMDDSEEQVNIDTQEENTANEQVENTSDNNVEEHDDSQAMDFNAIDEQQSDAETIIDEAFAPAASNEHVQSISTTDFVSLPSTSTGRPRRSTRAKKKVNFTVSLIENSSAEPNDDSTVNGNGKRTARLSRKLSTPKRSHAEPELAAAEEDEDGEETVHLSVIVQYLKCPATGCKKRCTDMVQLNGHLLVKHKIKKYRCKVKGCTKSFGEQSELTDHRTFAHRNLKNWPCDKCKTTRKSYHELSIHFGDYHVEGEFQCSADKCDFTGKTRKSVRNHQQRKHSLAKYECTFADCTMSFKYKSDLTRHLRVHTQKKPFACDECPKAFTIKSNLTVHQRTHSGLKPYICKWPGCGYSASHRSNVNTHVRTVHFGLPATKMEQTERRIIDTRDAGEFVEKITIN